VVLTRTQIGLVYVAGFTLLTSRFLLKLGSDVDVSLPSCTFAAPLMNASKIILLDVELVRSHRGISFESLCI